jgi:hypothetical protein
MIIKSFVDSIYNLISRPFFSYKNATQLVINTNKKHAIDHIANLLLTHIGWVNIVCHKVTDGILTVSSKLDAEPELKNLQKKYGLKYKVAHKPDNDKEHYTYVVTIDDLEKFNAALASEATSNIQKRYLANVDRTNNILTVQHDVPLTSINRPALLKLCLVGKGYNRAYYPLGDLQSKLKDNAELNNYVKRLSTVYVSYPFAVHTPDNNLITNIIRKNNEVHIQFTPEVFYKATELYKQQARQQVAIVINARVYGVIPLARLLQRQPVVIKFQSTEQAQQWCGALNYPIHPIHQTITLPAPQTMFSKLIALLLLLAVCIYLMLRTRRILRSVALILLAATITYFFKPPIAVWAALILSVLLLVRSNLYIRAGATALCIFSNLVCNSTYYYITLILVIWHIVILIATPI